jgi:muramoyltetrapeptide carboxypeptidase
MNSGLKAPRLKQGDRVSVVSPSSTPDPKAVGYGVKLLEGWGLKVELGAHVFDQYGHYLAGKDSDRLADLNKALRDPEVRAVFTTRGGKGAYRIAHALDFAMCRQDPKPLVGYSDTTFLHLALWNACRLVGFHGPYMGWDRRYYGKDAAELLRRALMEPEPIVVHQDPHELTSQVVIEGTASGILLGGSLGCIGKSVGWICPSFAGAILFIEAIDIFIGEIDSTLTQLHRSGCLDGVKGVAVGQFIRSAEPKRGKWSVVDVLYDRLSELNVPVLGGLPIGHGPNPLSFPLGTMTTLDTRTRMLTIEPGVT